MPYIHSLGGCHHELLLPLRCGCDCCGWDLGYGTAVYDVTRRETFEALEAVWMREFDIYSTVDCAIKMVVANKADLVGPSVLWAQCGGARQGAAL